MLDWVIGDSHTEHTGFENIRFPNPFFCYVTD